MHDAFALPAPRLADHIDTENGPSDEEGEKEAKRQRSEPTTPISTSSRLPYEYDKVMGITQVDPREADSVEEGLDWNIMTHLRTHLFQNHLILCLNLIFPTGVAVVHHLGNALSC